MARAGDFALNDRGGFGFIVENDGEPPLYVRAGELGELHAACGVGTLTRLIVTPSATSSGTPLTEPVAGSPTNRPVPSITVEPLPYTKAAPQSPVLTSVAAGAFRFNTENKRFYYVQASEDLVYWTTLTGIVQGLSVGVGAFLNRKRKAAVESATAGRDDDEMFI